MGMGNSQWANPPARAAQPSQSRPARTLRPMGFSLLSAAALALLVCFVSTPSAKGQYHTYGQIGTELSTVESTYPTLAKRFDLGSTVQGRSMWALHLTSNVNTEQDKPEFRYISTMHGDEVMGVEMCMRLIDYLTTNYGTDSRVTNIVDSVDLWIVPCMNPDGFVVGTRSNANGVDLNRNFPDPFTSPNNTTAGRQPETANVMNWAFGQSFILAANYHGGALVANYAFDNNASGISVYTPTPDDDVFIAISEEYSRYNLPMWNSSSFFRGITNGADWYAISGGMQDWSYRYMGTNEVTIEVSEQKTPSPTTIPGFWDDNRDSMLAYIEMSLIGVRGLVTDAQTGNPVDARVTVVGRNQTLSTDPDVGDYHRMLLPGTYDLTFEATGYDPQTVTGVVVNAGNATRVDVTMLPEGWVAVPAVSQWGLMVIALMLMAAGTIIMGRRQRMIAVHAGAGEQL
jgi:Zinc carboxypeptidase/Carboxypeptidase regulatory-like domain